MSSSYFTIINPYSQEGIKNVPWYTEVQLQQALDLVTQSNSIRSIQERANILLNLSILLDQNQELLAKIMVSENGKPFKDALLEIQRASVGAKNASCELISLKGEVYYSDSSYHPNAKADSKYCLSKKVPYGVVLAIVPFNFPVNLAIHKIAPAFGMGNTLLVKPHPQCFDTTQKLIELCYHAGMTKQDIQLIYPNNEMLLKLVSSDEIDLVSFTGGTKTAKILSTHLGIKKSLFELGGNDALVAFPDADLNKVVSTIMEQRFGCAGQRCTAPKRIFLHQSIKNNVIEILLAETKKIKIGDPQKIDTQLGPVLNQQAKNLILEKVHASTKLGAQSLINWSSEGNVISPIILDKVMQSMPVVSEEIFGPVASIFTFSQQEEVIRQINESRLGLQCGVFTQDISTLKVFFSEVRVGSVIANEGPAYRLDHFPFGGFKDSGYGREGTTSALDEFSTIKNLIF